MSTDFQGERLRQIRIIMDKSLADVGAAIQTSKQYIYQLETNQQFPAKLCVQALADFFGVNPIFFYRAYPNKIYSTECFFRKAKTTPVMIKEKAEHCAALLEDYIHFIENEFDLPANSFYFQNPDISDLKIRNITSEIIEKTADNIRRLWGLGLDTPIDNMIRSLENHGAVITTFSELSEKIDAFSINRERPIVVYCKDNTCRQRFSLAHECAHLVLHALSDEEDCDDLREDQANRFASAFLLPRRGFLKEFLPLFSKSYLPWNLLIEKKKRWKVSLAAILYRAHDLGLINSLRYRSACIYLRKNGQTKNEWGDDDIPPENAYLLPSITKELVEKYPEQLEYFQKSYGIPMNLISKISTYPSDSK